MHTKKGVWRSAFFINSALKIQCDVVKNTCCQKYTPTDRLLFWRFCPLGTTENIILNILIKVKKIKRFI